jgi:hypothetical protein
LVLADERDPGLRAGVVELELDARMQRAEPLRQRLDLLSPAPLPLPK